MDYEDWEYHHSKLPENHYDLEDYKERKEVEFLAELKARPEVKAYLKGFEPRSARYFLKTYAKKKAYMLSGMKFGMKFAEQQAVRYPTETEEAFEAILQKKLFNLQLLWRAGQITLPGIRVGYDFEYYEDRIRECYFIEPVTEQEVEVMRQYLKTRIEDKPWERHIFWQHYNDFMEMDEEGERGAMPDWYSWYDSYMGTGGLLHLPDLRGDKEKHYACLGRDEEQRLLRENPPPQPPVQILPKHLNFGPVEMATFAEHFDDDCFKKLFVHARNEYEQQQKVESLSGLWDAEEVLFELRLVPYPPPVRGGCSWREALVQCWREYLHGCIVEDIGLVYEEYMLYYSANIPAPKDDTKYQGMPKLEESNYWLKWILLGRELSGEPRDFDF